MLSPKNMSHCWMKMDAIVCRKGAEGGLATPFQPRLRLQQGPPPRRPIQCSSSSSWPIFSCASTLRGHIAKLAMFWVCFLC